MTAGRLQAGCYACDREGSSAQPPREHVWATNGWRVAHAFNSSLPGWLVVVPRRHVTAFADLDDQEATELGPLIVALGRALAEVVGCVKTYAMQFAEAEGFEHLHIHVVPRAPDLAPALRGPSVFGYLGGSAGEWLSEADQDAIAERITAALR